MTPLPPSCRLISEVWRKGRSALCKSNSRDSKRIRLRKFVILTFVETIEEQKEISCTLDEHRLEFRARGGC